MSKGFDIPSKKHLGNSHDYWKAPQKNSKQIVVQPLQWLPIIYNTKVRSMKKIINKIKRFYYRIINRDPLKKCTFHKEFGCSHVDGPLCDFPSCDIYREYREREDYNFVSCVSCEFQQECCSKQFGLGCNKGKISK